MATEDTKRGVSPVIGVILLVAVTIIITAVLGGFVMEMDPGSDNIQAGVTIDVQPATNTIVVEVITLGTADHVNVAGDPVGSLESSSPLSSDDLEGLDVGDTLEIHQDDLESDAETGQITAIGVAGGEERVIVSENYDVSS